MLPGATSTPSETVGNCPPGTRYGVPLCILTSQTPAHDRPSLRKRMKRQRLHRAAVNLDWQHRSGDSTNTAYPLPYDVPKLPTHGTASWWATLPTATEAQQPPFCTLVGCGFFFFLFSCSRLFPFSLLEPSYCCSEQVPPQSTSRPDSGAEQLAVSMLLGCQLRTYVNRY